MKGRLLLNDLSRKRTIIVLTALFVSMVPGAIFVCYHIFTNVAGPNPLLMSTIFKISVPVVLLCVVVYTFADTRLKRKVIFCVGLILYQIAVLPILWGINHVKLRMFISENKTELERVSNNILDKKWDWDQAVNYMRSKNMPVRLTQHIKKEKTVLFFINGLTDNCHGIAYSRSGKRTKENSCGTLVNWEQLEGHWYEWGTT
ncbi:MAG: hypothetical protein INR69_15425 [Mucilaginibacter polytrichastri]|nr:hypothetical protein [Mucilaginibacter polytrichastri]